MNTENKQYVKGITLASLGNAVELGVQTIEALGADPSVTSNYSREALEKLLITRISRKVKGVEGC